MIQTPIFSRATMSFRDLSNTLASKISLEVRQSQGIFFTPKEARDELFNSLPPGFNPTVVLEPSCGSGEFLDDARDKWPSSKFYGVEFNKDIYSAYVAKEGALKTVDNADFTTWDGCKKEAMLILGNPPYFVTKKKIPECMTGRPNIYVEFLYKCLTQHLALNGILSFVLPTSLLNASYYQPMRKILLEKTTVLCVKEVDAKYCDTSQATFILTVQNTLPLGQSKFALEIGGQIYLSQAAERISELVRGAKTISQLGCIVKTGEVVWNQVKFVEGKDVQKDKKRKNADAKPSIQEGDLVGGADVEGATILYYDGNLDKGEFIEMPTKNEKKKQYLKGFQKGPMHGPALLVSRGYGNNYTFKYSIITDGRPFYAENHVNVILPTKKTSIPNIGRIRRSLENQKTVEFISLFVGNGGLSQSELQDVLPIF